MAASPQWQMQNQLLEITMKGEPGIVNRLWRSAVKRFQRAEAPVSWKLSSDRWDFATESPGFEQWDDSAGQNRGWGGSKLLAPRPAKPVLPVSDLESSPRGGSRGGKLNESGGKCAAPLELGNGFVWTAEAINGALRWSWRRGAKDARTQGRKGPVLAFPSRPLRVSAPYALGVLRMLFPLNLGNF